MNLAERRRVLLFGDVIVATSAAVVAVVVWNLVADDPALTIRPDRRVWIPVLAATWLGVAALFGSYGVSGQSVNTRSLGPLFFASGIHLVAYLVWYFIVPPAVFPRIIVLVFEAAVVLSVAAWRRCWAWIGGREGLSRPIIIAPASGAGRALADYLRAHPESGFEVVGFVDGISSNDHREVHHSVLGSLDALPELVDQLDVAELAIDFRASPQQELLDAVLACYERGITITRACELLEALTGQVHVAHINDNWGMSLPLDHRGTRILYLASKRAMDIGGGLVGIALLAIFAVPIAIAIKIDSRGPVFYSQMRTGRGGRTFNIRKVRTMRVDAEAGGAVWASQNDDRATRVGRWLRRTHLDELPQFWNVLKGEMSLIGPRPERPEIDEELKREIPFYRMRWSVKPGVAGWAAVNGSYVDDPDKALERFERDLYYIKHQSPWLDMRIATAAILHAVSFRGQ